MICVSYIYIPCVLKVIDCYYNFENVCYVNLSAMDISTIRKQRDPEELAAIQCGVNGVSVRDLTVFLLLMQVKFWSQHISFILVGIIIVTSIRGLLITLTKVGLARTILCVFW